MDTWGWALGIAGGNDIICVLFGSRVPFVMPKVDNHFILIMECFVLGLMDGEAMDWLEKGQAKVQTFEIR